MSSPTCNGLPTGPSPTCCATAPRATRSSATARSAAHAGAAGRYLELPAGFNPRTAGAGRADARDPRHAGADAAALVQAALQRLRTGGYTYTLEPGVYGEHTADEFWFDRKEGFCEHIASAFVVLMRALGIPARIVTGYQGGELNGVDGFWVVRQSDAHAWAEVWHGRARLGARRPDRRRRARTHRHLPAPGAHRSGFVGQAMGSCQPHAGRSTCAPPGKPSTTAGTSGCSTTRKADNSTCSRTSASTSPSWEDLSYVLIGMLVLASAGGAGWACGSAASTTPGCGCWQRARRRLARAGAGQQRRQFAAPAGAAGAGAAAQRGQAIARLAAAARSPALCQHRCRRCRQLPG